jgi:hypothetical protein
VLVDPIHFEHVISNIGGLACLTKQRILLEVRLGKSCSQLDISVLIYPGQGRVQGKPFWAQQLPAAVLEASNWRRLVAFDNACASEQCMAVNHGWLEFDGIDSSPELPVPGLFAGLEQLVKEKLGCQPQAYRVAWHQDFINRLFRPLLDADLPGLAGDRLESCWRYLPHTAYLSQVGYLPERQEKTIRICLMDLEKEAVYVFLEQIGWPGDRDSLVTIINSLSGDEEMGIRQHMKVNMFQLYVWEELGPQIGLEFHFARKPQVYGTLLEQTWLDRLVAMGLADTEKVKALCQWPGCRLHRYLKMDMPVPVFRYINHVKITINPSGIEAKAYLAISIEEPLARFQA